MGGIMAGPIRRESPLYVQLAAEFRRLIARNTWHVGERLPTVDALASRFQVARITIRQAMTLLFQEGLITRSRGRGTHVVKAPERVRWHKLSASWIELMRSAPGGTTQLLEERPATTVPVVAPHEGRLVGPYRFLRVLGRRGDGPPIVVRDVYVQDAVFKSIQKKLGQTTMVDLLGNHADRVTVFNEITVATPGIARLLKIAVGSPVVEGRHVGTDKAARIVFLDFPVLRGDYVKFEITFKRPRARKRG